MAARRSSGGRRGWQVMCGRRAGAVRPQAGVAIIETALTIVPTLLIILGIMEFAIAFAIGASMTYVLGDVSDFVRTARLNGDPAQRTVSALTERAATQALPIAGDCLLVKVWEFEDLQDVARDQQDGALFNYTSVAEQAALAAGAVGESADARYVGGRPAGPTDILGGGADPRDFAVVTVTCPWHPISQIISERVGGVLPLSVATVVGFEGDAP